MFDLTTPSPPGAWLASPVPTNPRLIEAGRPTPLACLLDVVDYGMLLVLDGGCVVFANRVARAEMNDEHPLQLLGRDLRARCPRDVVAWHNALASALGRGMQALLKLGSAAQAIQIAVMPLPDAGEPAAAIVFGKRRVCEELSIDAFARQHGLTLAETRVLRHLCGGERPQDIAFGLGVKLSTVRTQINGIRAKTGSRDIGTLLQGAARLPPLRCLARRAAWSG